ncbi:hypothetical protein AVEN_246869-1 [Araneus ventricosus]|uniref:Uncharacterized protein n=1 Tax=Araneus ventricosus TaxID=182803 RepID=A0A4Y2L0P4_ARAVE|nr:hypothetical protein AVEN_246869-1 [Araneus ventricosus]
MTLSLDPLEQTSQVVGTSRLIHQGPKCTTPLKGRQARQIRGGILLSMRSRKQSERQQLLMESSLPTLEGRKKKAKTQKGGKNGRRSDTRVPRGREARHT